MKRKPRIPTDVPTLWLDEETNILRIIWPDSTVWYSTGVYLGKSEWCLSLFSGDSDADWLRANCYYCGPLFVSKENEP